MLGNREHGTGKDVDKRIYTPSVFYSRVCVYITFVWDKIYIGVFLIMTKKNYGVVTLLRRGHLVRALNVVLINQMNRGYFII